MAHKVEELITRNEVAQRLGCSIASVRRMEGADLHPLIGADGVRHFDPAEVASVAAQRGVRRDEAPLRADEGTRFAIGEPIAGLAPLPPPPAPPPPPRPRKSYIEREIEAANARVALQAIADREAATDDAREALEERRRARQDRRLEAIRKSFEAFAPATAPSPAPSPTLTREPVAAEHDDEILELVAELNDLMGIIDDD